MKDIKLGIIGTGYISSKDIDIIRARQVGMEISGHIVDFDLDKDGNKVINSLDLKSIDYIYHNPFKIK